MVSAHVPRSQTVAQSCEPAVLILFGLDMASMGSIFNEPCVICIYPYRMRAPGETLVLYELFDLRLEHDSECLPPESGAEFQLTTSLILHGDIRRIGVPGRPEVCTDEPCPDHLTRGLHVELISYVDRRSVGTILLGPSNHLSICVIGVRRR